MLTLAGIECGYGEVRVLHGVSLAVAPGEIVGLLGRNGAGKTTTLRAIMGSVRPRAGSIRLDDTELTGLRPHEIPKRGVAYVPQGRRLFPFLTVAENLRMGLLVRSGDAGTLEEVLALFPVLRERLRQRAGTLSGGEQQMLATARALCARPADPAPRRADRGAHAGPGPASPGDGPQPQGPRGGGPARRAADRRGARGGGPGGPDGDRASSATRRRRPRWPRIPRCCCGMLE